MLVLYSENTIENINYDSIFRTKLTFRKKNEKNSFVPEWEYLQVLCMYESKVLIIYYWDLKVVLDQ